MKVVVFHQLYNFDIGSFVQNLFDFEIEFWIWKPTQKFEINSYFQAKFWKVTNSKDAPFEKIYNFGKESFVKTSLVFELGF